MSMQTIYEETADRTFDHEREDGSSYCDYFKLKVTVFKDELNTHDFRVPLYVIAEEYESYTGDPDDPKTARSSEMPKFRRRLRTFTSGPDPKHVRRAISVIDGFKEPA